MNKELVEDAIEQVKSLESADCDEIRYGLIEELYPKGKY